MRVYITGIGLITPVGIGREDNWNSFLNSVSQVEEIPTQWRQYADFNTEVWAPLPEIDYPELGFRRTEILQLDPASLIAIVTAKEAFEDAGISFNQKDLKRNTFNLMGINPEAVTVNYGASFGGGSSFIDAHSYHLASKARKKLIAMNDERLTPTIEALNCKNRFNPFSVSMILGNMVPASVAMKFSVHGSVVPTVQACSSGTTAIGMAASQVRRGEYKMAVCGGVEYTKDDYGICFYGFDAARTMVNTASELEMEKINRPFDQDRSGLLYAEGGAATLILESEEHLDKRGGEPIAEIVGFGESFDAYSIMAPNPEGVQIERMIRMALVEAGISPNDVDYVNAHGTGTVANDQVEADIIKRIFGNRVAVNSTKSLIGHTFGASGAIEAAVCALSLRDQVLHPSLNLDNPISDLDFVTNKRSSNLEYTLSESFAFGGHNSCLILKAA